MTRLVMVAEMTGRDLWRRRAVLGLLALMPLAFYLVRRDSTGLAVRFVSLGLAWRSARPRCSPATRLRASNAVCALAGTGPVSCTSAG